jgi:outer membrane protease
MNKAAFLLILFIIIHLLSAINPLYCQDNEQNNEQNRKYGFSIGTGFGVAYGQAFEYVYPYHGETKGKFLSELTWDMKPVCYAGFNVDLGLINPLKMPGFFFSLAFKAGIPGSTGNLEDRDWMSTVNSDLTHFSQHENETDEFVCIDLFVGASFPIKKYLYIKPFISGSWMHFNFTGRNGYLQHSYENPNGSGIYEPIGNIPIVPVYGTVISYRQDWLLLATGFTIGTNILSPFSFDLSFQITPLTYCGATDNHYPDTAFKDFTGFGLFLEPKGSFSIAVKYISFLLDVSYRYISGTEGESYKGSINSSLFSHTDNKAGAGLSLWNFQFIIKLTI